MPICHCNGDKYRGPYLDALIRKPGPLPVAIALEQARAASHFTPRGEEDPPA